MEGEINNLIIEDFYRGTRRIYKNLNGYPKEFLESDFSKTNITKIITDLVDGNEV